MIKGNSVMHRPSHVVKCMTKARDAIFGLGCSPRALTIPTRTSTTWSMGLPASSDEADAIIIFGGDGQFTVIWHLSSNFNCLSWSFRAGSGNDFARALNLRSINDSLAAWQRFEKQHKVCAQSISVRSPCWQCLRPRTTSAVSLDAD